MKKNTEEIVIASLLVSVMALTFAIAGTADYAQEQQEVEAQKSIDSANYEFFHDVSR